MNSPSYGAQIDVWSVGCIFAEMLGRTPLFPGRDTLQQIQLLTSVLCVGSDELGWITDGKAADYVRALLRSKGRTEPTDWHARYPDADVEEIDLLARMLAFDPQRRLTPCEALEHPFLQVRD